ncbi:RDD family protein [Sporosarcina sp. 179-K 8C2 HS]|uniref:RDD family protein n=1 Tax=Sporosarcina sp. 179-K 8C2 HS TaxID=3142387 RepID=UPI00399F5C7F
MLFLKRLTAYWLDCTLIAFLLIGFQWALYRATDGFPFNHFEKGYQIELWVLLTFSLPVWLYFILSEMYKQRTIGKKLLKLTISTDRETKISWKQALIRTAVKLLPWELTHLIVLFPKPWWGIEEPENFFHIFIPNGLLVFYIVFFAWTKGTKGFHDQLARTRVKELAK